MCILNSSSDTHTFQADLHKLITSIKFFQSSREETDALANLAIQSNICFKMMCVEEGREDVRGLSLPEGWPDFPCPLKGQEGGESGERVDRVRLHRHGLTASKTQQRPGAQEEGAEGTLLMSF